MASLAAQHIAKMDLPLGSNPDQLPAISKRTAFDSVTIAFHWVTVVLVLGLFTTAIWHGQSHDDMLKVLLLRIHRSLGVTVWTTTVLRLVWRATNAKFPPFPDDMTQLHRALVQISEYCLYALLIIQPTIGFAAVLTRGRSFTLFWWHVPPLIPHFPAVQPALLTLHRIDAWILALLITAHAVNVLVRHFIIRDNMLARMAPLAGPRQLSPGRDSQPSFGC